jgi:hypothetical protein
MDTPPSCYEIEARVRNGISEYEGVLYTPSTPSPYDPGNPKWQMNPTGKPVWNTNGNAYGDIHSFLFTYIPSSGTSIWKIDFNRDGDYNDLNESISNVAPTLAGRGFQYISILGQGNDFGRTATINHFTINGVDFGSYYSATNTPFSILFEDHSGLFNDVTISGEFSFSGHGSPERPRIWVRLGESNIAPTCLLTHPLDNSLYPLGSNISLAATATDMVGRLIKVEFYDGPDKIGEDLDSPYTFEWDNAPSGFRTLQAKAIDNHQAITFSNPVTILVNAPPNPTIIHPSDGEIFFDPDTIKIQATINDANDSINRLEFFINNIRIGTDSVPPYLNSTFLNPSAGTYSLKVKSTDPYGATSFSQPININVRCIREDLNNDGVVSTFDFLLLLIDFGNVCTGCPPDFNDDGKVDTFDYLRLLRRLGYKCN